MRIIEERDENELDPMIVQADNRGNSRESSLNRLTNREGDNVTTQQEKDFVGRYQVMYVTAPCTFERIPASI